MATARLCSITTSFSPMATARRLSMTFLVTLLVASSCFVYVAQASVQGRTLRMTHLQDEPGTGQFTFVILEANTALEVSCRLESSVVNLDSWWLNAKAIPQQKTGWVASYDAVCYGAGLDCDNVPHC